MAHSSVDMPASPVLLTVPLALGQAIMKRTATTAPATTATTMMTTTTATPTTTLTTCATVPGSSGCTGRACTTIPASAGCPAGHQPNCCHDGGNHNPGRPPRHGGPSRWAPAHRQPRPRPCAPRCVPSPGPAAVTMTTASTRAACAVPRWTVPMGPCLLADTTQSWGGHGPGNACRAASLVWHGWRKTSRAPPRASRHI